MIIKIGNDFYYPQRDGPVMVILTEADKANIRGMPEDQFKYSESPDDYFEDVGKYLEWMREGLNNELMPDDSRFCPIARVVGATKQRSES